MACQLCVTYQSQLKLMADELEDLRKKYADCRLQSQVDSVEPKLNADGTLQDSGLSGCTANIVANSESDYAALYFRAVEAEKEVERLNIENTSLKNKLNSKEVELSDHIIKIRNLEEQLRAVLGSNVSDINKHSVDVEVIAKRDLDRMHSQLLYKDTRIMELNSTILDKERQILDLQEMCREQSQVVQARSKAFEIVQQRVIEMDSKKTRDISTETDVSLVVKGQSPLSVVGASMRKENSRRSVDFSTPGRAVMLMKTDRHSPPPLDPSEDQSSITTETLTIDDGDRTSFELRRKHRKKVTFDLKPQRTVNVEGLADSVCDDIAQAVVDLTSENDELRSIIRELENDTVASAHSRIMQLEEEVEKVRREGKNQALKAKAAAQGRIRDLEEKIANEQEEHKEEINRLKSTVEALRATREWNVEENARLLEQIAATKQQCDEIREELSESLLEQNKLRSDSEKDREMIVRLAGNVEEAQRTVNTLLEQRVSILDDVDRLKDAIEAQDEYIAMLEDDVVIYENHIGLLRDSLGASKVENRAFIKSKAFETKLRALEQEKEQITKRNNDERIRIRALNAKIRSLEAQNAELIDRLKCVDVDNSGSQSRSVASGQCNHSTADDDESVSSPWNCNESFEDDQKEEMFTSKIQQVYGAAATGAISKSLPNLFSTFSDEQDHNYGGMNCWAKSACGVGNIERSPEVANLTSVFLAENVQSSMVQTSNFAVDESIELEELRDKLKIYEDECKNARNLVRDSEVMNANLEAILMEAKLQMENLKMENEELKTKLGTITSELDSREAEYIKNMRSHVNENAENEVLLALVEKEVQVLEYELEKTDSQEGDIDLDQPPCTPVYSTLDPSPALTDQKPSDVICGSQSHIPLMDPKEEQLKYELREKESKIILLQSAVEKYKAELEEMKHYKVVSATTQTEHETELCNEFAERESVWLTSLNEKDAEISALHEKVDRYEKMAMEDKVVRKKYEVLETSLNSVKVEKDDLMTDLEKSRQKMEAVEEEKCQLEKLLADAKTEYSLLRDLYNEVRNSLETEKQQLRKLNSKLDLLTKDNEAKSQRIDELGKLEAVILDANHAETKYRQVLDERNNLLREIEVLKSELREYRNQKLLENSSVQKTNNDLLVFSTDASDTSCQNKKNRLSVTEVSLESVPTTSVEHGKPDVLLGSDFVEHRERSSLEIENVYLRECVAQNSAMRDTLSEDVDRLLTIKAELETTVETLKGEIWSLETRLKAAVNDRDDLSDKLCALTQMMEDERAKARDRERELEEQKDFAERSQRQAALAENDSNHRLLEWQEKSAGMENSYSQLRNAYEQLNGYYQQLQEAYNALYASAMKTQSEDQTEPEFRNVHDNSEISCTAEVVPTCTSESSAPSNTSFKEADQKRLVSVYKTASHLKKQLEELKGTVEESVVGLRDEIPHLVESAVEEIKRVLDECLARENVASENIRKICTRITGKDVLSVASAEVPEIVAEAFDCLRTQENQFQELREALDEKRIACDVLEGRLEEYEKSSEQLPNQSASYIAELEKMLADTQNSLKEQSGKTEELRRVLEAIEGWSTDSDKVETLAVRSTSCGDPSSIQSTSPAVHMICRGTNNVPCSANLQLAILAARLTTKETDNMALLRCNEELAETNLKLQNELDSLNEKLYHAKHSCGAAMTTVETTEFTSPTDCLDNKENCWNWDAASTDIASVDSIPEDGDLKAILKQLRSKEKELLRLQENERSFEEEISRKDKRLEASEEYALELEEKLDKLEGVVEDLKTELKETREKSKFDVTDPETAPDVSSSDLEYQVEKLRKENEVLLLEVSRLRVKCEQSNVNAEEETLTAKSEVANGNCQQQKRDERTEKMTDVGSEPNGWSDDDIDLLYAAEEATKSETASAVTDVQELKDTITRLNEELIAVTKSREAVEKELLLSNERSKNIESDFEKLKQRFLVCKKDLDNVQVPSIEPIFADADDEKVFGDSAAEYDRKERFAEGLHLNEESYAALVESEKSLRRLLEGLETKLHNTEEYSVNLKEENATLESNITTLKKEVSLLKSENDDLRKANEALELANNKTKKEAVTCLTLETKNKALEEELLTLRSKIELLSSRLTMLESEKAEANTTIESMLLTAGQMTETTLQVDVSTAVEQLKSQLSRIMTEKKNLESELTVSKKQNELLQECECRLTEVVSDYETRMLDSDEKIQFLRKSIEEAKGQYTKLENEQKKCIDEKERLQLLLDESKREYQSMAAELDRLKSQELVVKRKKRTVAIQTTNSADSATSDLRADMNAQKVTSNATTRFVQGDIGEASLALTNESTAKQINELKAECDKLAQDKKRMSRKLKQMQSELSTLRRNRSNDVNESIAQSPLLTLPSASNITVESFTAQSSVDPYFLYGKHEARGSEYDDSYATANRSDDENVTSQTLRGSKDSLVQSPFQRFSVADEPVRRRKSGFRNDSEK